MAWLSMPSCRLYDKTNTGSITLRDFAELNSFMEKVQGQYRQHNRSGQGLGPQEVRLWCHLHPCSQHGCARMEQPPYSAPAAAVRNRRTSFCWADPPALQVWDAIKNEGYQLDGPAYQVRVWSYHAALAGMSCAVTNVRDAGCAGRI